MYNIIHPADTLSSALLLQLKKIRRVQRRLLFSLTRKACSTISLHSFRFVVLSLRAVDIPKETSDRQTTAYISTDMIVYVREKEKVTELWLRGLHPWTRT